MKHRKDSAVSRSLIQAKVALSKNATIPNLFAVIDRVAPSQYDALAVWIEGEPSIRRRLYNEPFPASIDNWQVSATIFPDISIGRKLHWFGSYLRRNADKLNDYISLTHPLAAAFSAENRDECYRILNEVEKRFGISYWYIKRKIALLQHFDGLEAQKRYAQSIKDSDKSEGIIRYVTHYVSYRSEETVSPVAFRNRYNLGLNTPELHPIARSYFRYHITNEMPCDETDLANIVLNEAQSTVIDCYESIIGVAQTAVSCHPLLAQNIGAACQNLRQGISDPRLARIVANCGGGIDLTLASTSEDSEVFNLFRYGKYEDAYAKGISMLKATQVDVATIFVAALCRQNNQKCDYPIIPEFQAAYGGDGAPDAVSRLARRGWAMQGTAFANFIKAVLHIEASATAIPVEDRKTHEAILGLDNLHPFQKRWFRGSQKASLFPEFARVADDILGLGGDERNWIVAVDSYASLNYVEALGAALKLSESKQEYYKRLGIRIAIECQLRLGRVKDAVNLAADIFTKDNIIERILPIERIFESVNKSTHPDLSKVLAYVIIADLYARRKGVSAHHKRRYAYEDFLSAHIVGKPSDSMALLTSENRTQYVYFLKNICVESVMDSSFGSSLEVATERIAICRMLTEIDPDNKSAYQAEMRDIAQRLAIKKRLREVEQSKIFVDIKGVKEAAKRELSESYSRYISFLEKGLSIEDKEYFRAVSESASSGDIKAVLSRTIPRNERTALLETIFLVLRDEFVSSSQHGLDGYLSVRIRHGTLAGQLRSPLEAEKLLTQRDSHTNQYKENAHWLSLLPGATATRKVAITEAFSKFSASFDALIEEVSKKWLQIKKDKVDNGLIDFVLIPGEIAILSADIKKDTSFDEFLDTVLAHFMRQRLEISLAKIRQRFQDEVKPRVRGLLLELQTSIEAATSGTEIGVLRTAIGHALTATNTTLDRITEWFRLPAAEKEEPFLIDEAISICTVTRPDFRLKLSIVDELKDLKIRGNFTSFVDILYLVFENVVKHAGTSRPAIADVSASLIGNELVIRIQNEIGDGVANDANCLRVMETATAVSQQPFSTSVKKEGGTGFFKVKKILYHDFRSSKKKVEPSLDFGFIDKKYFFVEIKIPVLIKDETDENTNS